jgi:hypothetical protein
MTVHAFAVVKHGSNYRLNACPMYASPGCWLGNSWMAHWHLQAAICIERHLSPYEICACGLPYTHARLPSQSVGLDHQLQASSDTDGAICFAGTHAARMVLGAQLRALPAGVAAASVGGAATLSGTYAPRKTPDRESIVIIQGYVTLLHTNKKLLPNIFGLLVGMPAEIAKCHHGQLLAGHYTSFCNDPRMQRSKCRMHI